MAPPGPIFVVGSEPMIGSQVARLFAMHAFTKVALFFRSTSNLSRDACFVTSTAPSVTVHTYAADVTDHAVLSAALEKALSEAGVPEVVVYNAAPIVFGVVGQYSPANIVEDFKIPNLGLHTTASILLTSTNNEMFPVRL